MDNAFTEVLITTWKATVIYRGLSLPPESATSTRCPITTYSETPVWRIVCPQAAVSVRPNHAAGNRIELAALGNIDIEQGDTIYRFCLIHVRHFIGMPPSMECTIRIIAL